MAEKRRQFTREFKLEAVRLLTSGERRLAELARDLGVRADILRGWQKQAEGRAGLKSDDVFRARISDSGSRCGRSTAQAAAVTAARGCMPSCKHVVSA